MNGHDHRPGHTCPACGRERLTHGTELLRQMTDPVVDVCVVWWTGPCEHHGGYHHCSRLTDHIGDHGCECGAIVMHLTEPHNDRTLAYSARDVELLIAEAQSERDDALASLAAAEEREQRLRAERDTWQMRAEEAEEVAGEYLAARAAQRVVPPGFHIDVSYYPTNDGQRHALATVVPDDPASDPPISGSRHATPDSPESISGNPAPAIGDEGGDDGS